MKRKRKRSVASSKFAKRKQQPPPPPQQHPQQQQQQQEQLQKRHHFGDRKCSVASSGLKTVALDPTRSPMLLASNSTATTTTTTTSAVATTTRAKTASLVPRPTIRARSIEAAVVHQSALPTTNNNNGPHKDNLNEMDLIKSSSKLHSWHWNEDDKSKECIVGADRLQVCFHPECSESTAAIRGSEPLIRNGGYYYWEITVFEKTYGTSVMFGLCTKNQLLYEQNYCNLVGLDGEGWSLSHKGLAWHNGISQQYTPMFPTDQPITIGLLFNTLRGELSYFMDGKNLGVAFSGLNNVKSDLYPVIGSTAKCTRMRLTCAYRSPFVSLLDRSCFVFMLQHSQDNQAKLAQYFHDNHVPRDLIRYLAGAAQSCDIQTETDTQHGNQYESEQTEKTVQHSDQYSLKCRLRKSPSIYHKSTLLA